MYVLHVSIIFWTFLGTQSEVLLQIRDKVFPLQNFDRDSRRDLSEFLACEIAEISARSQNLGGQKLAEILAEISSRSQNLVEILAEISKSRRPKSLRESRQDFK